MKPIIYYSLLFLLLLSSCNDDNKYTIKNPGTTEDPVQVVFSVKLPVQTTSASTRAMDDAAENHVETIDVLAFKYDSNGNETFLYRAEGTNITDVANTINEKQFTATLIKKAFAQRFVILANARDELNDLIAMDGLENTGIKKQVLKRLIYKNENEWNATSEADFTPFPMWGESASEILTDGTTGLSTTIKMLRMLARIDVQIDSEAEGDFKLRTVSLFNRHTKGHVVPNTTAEYWDSSSSKAIKPTLPDDDDGTLKILGPLSYKNPTTADSAFIKTIYTFEAPAGEKDKKSQATCLVVGGYYENDTKPSYYRLDFINSDDEGNFINYKDILRNHRYVVNIVKILGPGYETEEDAFNSESINMEVIIKDWDEGEYGDIIFDGHYLLAVDPGKIILTRERKEGNEIKIYTDYPAGWKAVKDENCDWLHITSPNPVSGSADSHDILTFTVDENTTGKTRATTIQVTAGRLTYIVEIIQTTEEALSLLLTDENKKEVSELIFASVSGLSYAGLSNILNVDWLPVAENCIITDYDVTSAIFSYSSTNPINSNPLTGGSDSFTIVASEMTSAELKADPFLEKQKRVDFTVYKSPNIIRSVFLKQVNYTVVPENVEDSYLMDGSTYSFIVKSNADWTATLTRDDDNIIVAGSYPTSGTANKSGEAFSFKMINDEEGDLGGGEAYVTFSSPEGKFHDVVVKLVGESPIAAETTNVLANCYMLQPGGSGLRFPVKQANADGTTRLQANTDFELELLWSDHPNFLGANAPVASYKKDGIGSGAYIIVNPGSVAGNSVIALKVGGVIKWSWHIWTVDYNPETTYKEFNGYTVMNRNLGAISAEPTSDKHMGTIYQWGRKDPFPGPSGRGSSNFFTIYSAPNQPFNFDKGLINLGSGTSAADYIEYSINNPIYYMIGGSSFKDWLSNSHSDPTLWGKSKTAYDPCPAGWQLPLGENKSPVYGLGLWPYNSYTWTNNVGLIHEVAGFYPAIKEIGPEGTLIGDETAGYYWTGEGIANGNLSRGYNVKASSPENSAQQPRVHGRAVRCVKEGY